MSAPYSPQGAPVNPKSKITAAVLAFFLGQIGVHSFYLGQKQKGIIHIALAVLAGILYSVGTAQMASSLIGASAGSAMPTVSPMLLLGGLLLAANGIWAFVEFILILVKSDADFAAAYN